MLETDAAVMAGIEQKIAANDAAIAAELAAVATTLQTPSTKRAFAGLRAANRDYAEARKGVFVLSRANRDEQAYALTKLKGVPPFLTIVKSYTALFEAKVKLAKRAIPLKRLLEGLAGRVASRHRALSAPRA